MKTLNKNLEDGLFPEDDDIEKDADIVDEATDLEKEKAGFDVASDPVEESLEEHREREQKAWDDDEEEELI